METNSGIDYDKLKQPERIHFFDDLVLFEDELADNGIAELRVKIVRQLDNVKKKFINSSLVCNG